MVRSPRHVLAFTFVYPSFLLVIFYTFLFLLVTSLPFYFLLRCPFALSGITSYRPQSQQSKLKCIYASDVPDASVCRCRPVILLLAFPACRSYTRVAHPHTEDQSCLRGTRHAASALQSVLCDHVRVKTRGKSLFTLADRSRKPQSSLASFYLSPLDKAHSAIQFEQHATIILTLYYRENFYLNLVTAGRRLRSNCVRMGSLGTQEAAEKATHSPTTGHESPLQEIVATIPAPPRFGFISCVKSACLPAAPPISR